MNKSPPDKEAALSAAFVAAAQAGQIDIVRHLIDAGADIHADHENALRMAAKAGQAEVVNLLLERGADGDAKGPDRRDAWFYAFTEGHKVTLEVISVWLQKDRARQMEQSSPEPSL